MKVINVFKVAKWFIKNNYDNPRNNFDGNMKLQKLLYLAQLVHLYLYDKELFEEPIMAFEKGPVVEAVRIRYRDDTFNFIEEAKTMFMDLNQKIIKTLELTVELFGEYTAKELSEFTHTHACWEEALENSTRSNGFHSKNDSIIPIEEMKKHALPGIKQVIEAKKMTSDDNDKCEIVNGKEFYYDPSNISLNDRIYEILSNFEGEDNSYTVYEDPSQGLVIY
ncbi:Uncharacterized phage-associated protein [Halanaerobium congolense]|uniref:Uncharacterized phage-associated protein n=1 Tax=Halanaerobium congolense TaxID=54121 RepID=A0A1G8PS95_9FIRM|nr:type II toxin-antitoxin system antitoxin SocA domain-containing protein [Halanaerobium congolense]SDI95085.1 Uncharacterized phage-associated protein [Halanaerobium congolense]SES89840.1 Uncharacterized phage-associated protein [Halanaerobium congolense]SET16286.1 Uncharacterized phage-associated protein [Halanaerobium congolense]